MPYHSSHLVIISLLGLILLPVGIKGAGEDVITAEDLIEQVRILAAPEMEGRASGMSGGTRAAAHIAEEFRKIRLQPLGDRGDYLQLFEVATGVRLGTRNRLALDLTPGYKEYQVGIMFQPFSLSAGARASGEVVFAGYGITAPELNYDDYAGLDVQGKIVLVMTHEPQETNPQGPFRRPETFHYTEIRYKVINAREHGAKGIIIVTDPNHADAERARLFGLRGGGSTSAGIVAVNTVAEWVHPRFLRVVDSWGETGGRET